MNRDKYDAAVKKLKAEKTKSNYMVLAINGNERIILPHAEGVTVLNALQLAEKFDRTWSPERILPMHSAGICSELLTTIEYEQYKLAGMLNVSMSDIRTMDEAIKKESHASD